MIFYDIVPLTPISWSLSTGDPSEYKYSNISRPTVNECLDYIPSCNENHPAKGAIQQSYGSVVGIIEDDETIQAVVEIDFDDVVCIEYIPDHLKSSHRAANNFGQYPYNGAIRTYMPKIDAEQIIEDDEDKYARIIDS